jgi:Icc-related predicted phosphoesterase
MLEKAFQLNKGDAEKGRAMLKKVCTYLEHEFVEVEGIKIFGSPYTPEFYDWAFMYKPQEGIHIWNIPHKEIDILVTHGPPLGILDQVQRGNTGCLDLLNLIHKVKPKYHLFGHIHEAYGEFKD